MALTFMAKFDEREGNSCHIHCSFRGTDGALVMADDAHELCRRSAGPSSPGSSRYMRELTLLLAPNINSYKRYVEGSFAPTALRWGRDNRTCALPAGRSRRRRCGWRTASPAATSTPTWPRRPSSRPAWTGIEAGAGARAGVRRQRLRRPGRRARADQPAPRPWTCGEGSEFARTYFGDDVVEHYANMAAVELAAFGAVGHRLGAVPGVRAACERPRDVTHDVVNPATEEVVTTSRSRTSPRPTRRSTRAAARFATWRAVAPGRPRPAAAPVRRARSTPHLEELAQLEVRQLRAHHRQRPLGGRQRPRRADLLQRGAGAAVRPADPGGRRRRHHLPRAAGRRRRHRAVELPDADRRLGVRARAGRRQHRRPQAGRAHPADRDPARRAGAGGRPAAEDVLHRAARQGLGRRAAAVEHPDVRKIVFTGSTAVGKGVMAGCADQVKRVTLELGGKSANVVFADADLEQAAATAPYAVFDNAGQDCCARSRILVQRSAYDRFLELLEPAVQGVRVEDPRAGHRRDGPADQPRPVGAGRRPTCRTTPRSPSAAPRPTGPGFWFPPTVLAPVDPRDRAVHEEIFGPVVVVVPFEDEADAVRIANQGEYGLSGSIWTRDVGRALRVSRGIEAGQPVGQQPLVGALLDAVRRLQAVRARPRARPRRPALVHRREERVHLDGRVSSGRAGGRAAAGRPGRGRDRRGAAASGWPPPGGSPPRARTSSSATSTRPPARPRPTRSAALFVQVDVTVAGAGRRPVPGRGRHVRRPGHRVQQRRHLPAGRRLDPHHRPRRLAPRAGGQPDLGLPVLQGGDPAHAGARQGLDHQHRVVRGADGRGDLADLLHRVQGRRAGDVARARRAVRPRGHPGQRALPRAGEHPAAAGAVRQGPRAGRPAAGAHPGGPVRRAGRDRRRRRVPRLATTPRSSPRRSSWSTAALSGAYVTPL